MKARNPQIGTAPCPVRDCTKEAKLFRFKERSEAATGRRFAGRLYGDCEDHGRFGGDGRTGINEYFLNMGTIWPAGQKPAEAAAVESPVKPQKEPAPAPAPAAVKKAPAPAPEPETAPARIHAQPARSRDVWDL